MSQGTGILYYVPGVPDVAPGSLPAALAHIEKPGGRIRVFKGPDGDQGCMLSPQNVVTPGYYPDAQTWTMAADGAFWIGWYNDGKPGPVEFARERMVEGKAVAMLDGHFWQVPRMRLFPWVFAMEGGKRVQRTATAYREIYQKIEGLQAKYFSDGVTFPEMLDAVVSALALNYRISEAEVLALEMAGNVELQEAFEVLISHDLYIEQARAMQEAAKKKDGVTTPGG